MFGLLPVNADAVVVVAVAVVAAGLGDSKIDTFWILFVQGGLVVNIEITSNITSTTRKHQEQTLSILHSLIFYLAVCNNYP